MFQRSAGLVLQIAVVSLLALSAPAAAQTGSPLGDWTTEGGKARVRIAACPQDAQRLCGVIEWSYRPPGAKAGPLLDINNQDPEPALAADRRPAAAPGLRADRAGQLGRRDDLRPRGRQDLQVQDAARRCRPARGQRLHPVLLPRPDLDALRRGAGGPMNLPAVPCGHTASSARPSWPDTCASASHPRHATSAPDAARPKCMLKMTMRFRKQDCSIWLSIRVLVLGIFGSCAWLNLAARR